jgi:DNA mismatch repair protein MutS2
MKGAQDQQTKRSLASVDWLELLEYLAKECQTVGGKSLALGLIPVLQPEEVARQVELIRAVEAGAKDFEPLVFGVCDEIPKILETLTEGEVLTPKELLTVSDFLQFRKRVEDACSHLFEDYPALQNLLDHSYGRDFLVKAILERITPHGEVAWDASPKLADLSRQEAKDREDIEKQLTDIGRRTQYQDMLMDTFVTLRDGRYVLPVKMQYQNFVKGIIHDVSNSKKTAFIEPFAIVKINNHLIQILEAKQEEKYKILRYLTSKVEKQSSDVQKDLTLYHELDVWIAKWRLGKSWEGVIVEPQESWGGWVLDQARHPLLALKSGQVVANSVRIGADHKGLVVSGPNMGGKTVLLKCLGSILLLSYCGVPVPCSRRSQIPLFRWFRFVIGDQQSLEEGLSSFSFQVDMVRNVPPKKSLGVVLVDEIMTATDPEEGEALAQALLDTWSRNPHVICCVSTHYARIKQLSLSGSLKLAFGSMAYVEGLPTYRFIAGGFGQSFGVETAEKMGVDPEIVAHARRLLGFQKVELNQLISSIQEKHAKADRMMQELEQKEVMQQRRFRELEQQAEALVAQKESVEADVVSQVWAAYDTVLKEVRQELSKQQQKPEPKKLAKKEAQVSEVIDRLRGRLHQLAEKRHPAKGDSFFIPHLGKVQVIEWHQDKKYALVKIKNKTIRLALEHFSQAKKI